MNRESKLLMALALVLVLTLSGLTTAQASATPTPTPPSAAETSEAAITKLLKVPVGTPIPNDFSFKFQVTPKGVDGIVDPQQPIANVGGTDANGNVTITYPKSNPSDYNAEKTVGNVVEYYLESVKLFGGVTWPHAGVYDYEIKETSVLTDFNLSASNPVEKLTLSKAVYDVRVYVAECDNPSCGSHTSGHLVITHIGAVKTVNDDGSTNTDNNKVDPTPGGGSGADDDYKYSKMIFTNEYWKTMGPTNPDPEDGDSTLIVSKEVTGDFASRTNYFDFSMTIQVPELKGVEKEYRAYVVEQDPTDPTKYEVVTTIDNGAKSGEVYILFTAGVSVSFKLKDGQSLMFIDTPVGTSYTLEEFGTTAYTPKVTVVYDKNTRTYDTGSLSANYELPNEKIKKTYLYVSEDGSSADFTNDRGTVTPTGLNLNDLPFIAMIALALGAVTGYLLIKSRKRKGDSN